MGRASFARPKETDEGDSLMCFVVIVQRRLPAAACVARWAWAVHRPAAEETRQAAVQGGPSSHHHPAGLQGRQGQEAGG